MVEDLSKNDNDDVLAPGHHVTVTASFTWDAVESDED